MSTIALVHGGGGSAWDWHLVEPELRKLDHDTVAVDLPTEDPSKGWWDYADVVVEGVGERRDLVVVAHSLGGFTAPLVCARRPADLLVLVAAMIPAPGERFAILVLSQASRLRWRLGDTSGVARAGTLRLVAPMEPGRYTLRVEANGHVKRAAVIVVEVGE